MKVTRTRIVVTVLLLVTGFSLAALRLWHLHRVDETNVTIRFAHWQLEGGVREAFDQVARDYMAAHPGVRVVQMVVPDRVYPGWLTTQLSGGTAPDLVQLGRYPSADAGNEILARHFIPLTEATRVPNPYNAGTAIAGDTWRSTFADNLSGWSTWSEALQEVYGIPTTIFSIRVYYNRELMRKVAGTDQPPRTLEEFLRLCRAVRQHAQENQVALAPISGSGNNVIWLVDTLFKSQTQRWRVEEDLFRSHGVMLPSLDVTLLRLARGEIRLANPPFHDGFSLVHEVGRELGPSVIGMTRDDAALQFLQQRSLMIISGTWDASGLAGQAPFDVGAFPLPPPSHDLPRYGANTFGPQSEASLTGMGTFGITRYSKAPDVALDFLRYLTSLQGADTFTRLSRWPSALLASEPPEEMKVFAPRLDGYPEGWSPIFEGADLRRAFDVQRHLLFNTGGGADAFLERFEPMAVAGARSDLRRAMTDRQRGQRRQDAALFAAWWQSADDADAGRRLADLAETQLMTEVRDAYIRRRLQEP
jgi:raffinose/stachyose/melibiose transport system substrate-binding protein